MSPSNDPRVQGMTPVNPMYEGKNPSGAQAMDDVPYAAFDKKGTAGQPSQGGRAPQQGGAANPGMPQGVGGGSMFGTYKPGFMGANDMATVGPQDSQAIKDRQRIDELERQLMQVMSMFKMGYGGESGSSNHYAGTAAEQISAEHNRGFNVRQKGVGPDPREKTGGHNPGLGYGSVNSGVTAQRARENNAAKKAGKPKPWGDLGGAEVGTVQKESSYERQARLAKQEAAWRRQDFENRFGKSPNWPSLLQAFEFEENKRQDQERNRQAMRDFQAAHNHYQKSGKKAKKAVSKAE